LKMQTELLCTLHFVAFLRRHLTDQLKGTKLKVDMLDRLSFAGSFVGSKSECVGCPPTSEWAIEAQGTHDSATDFGRSIPRWHGSAGSRVVGARPSRDAPPAGPARRAPCPLTATHVKPTGGKKLQ